MKAVIIGASGASGKELVEELVNSEHITEIIALVRKKKLREHPKLKQIITDFDKLENYSREINGDFAFSCMGTTLKTAGSKEAQYKIDHDYQLEFAKICSQNKVPVFALISAMGANPNSRLFYNKMKGELENEIEKLDFKKLLIFQPGLLSRPDSDRWGEKFAEKTLHLLNQIGLLRNYKPLKVSLLAKSIWRNSLNKPNGKFKIRGKEILNSINS